LIFISTLSLSHRCWEARWEGKGFDDDDDDDVVAVAAAVVDVVVVGRQ
jgi:hypothetical protein